MWDKIKKYLSCSLCHGKGVRQVKIKIPNSKLSAADRAEIMVNGGYAFVIKEVPCTH